MLLRKDQQINTDSGQIAVKEFIGEGGQGEVYLVEKAGQKLALKLYKGKVNVDFAYNLRNNIKKGSPSKSFLWPKEIVDKDGLFGYLMDLRPQNYVSFVSLLTGKNAFPNQTLLINWCLELCMAFKKLHEQGYSYQDLNDGSFFMNTSTGELLICDNDNVTADKRNLGVLGKMRYMAPEIVRGDKDPYTGKRQLPDMHSDRFSLAVILFLALCLGNPFEGECLKNYDIVDEKAEYEMYGKNPVFIYHKTDKSNRPIRGYHSSVLKRWAYLPIYIKEAFHRTFVDGLKDRENQRTTAIEWIKILTKYRDELMTCHNCGYQYIAGLVEKNPYQYCPRCNSKNYDRCILSIGKNKIILEPGKKLYQTQLDKYSCEYNKQIGEVIRNKNNSAVWGIKIQSSYDILIRDKYGNERKISAGGVIPIIKDLNIFFNQNTTGEIQLWKTE